MIKKGLLLQIAAALMVLDEKQVADDAVCCYHPNSTS